MWVLPDRRCSAPRVQIPSIRFSIQINPIRSLIRHSPGGSARSQKCPRYHRIRGSSGGAASRLVRCTTTLSRAHFSKWRILEPCGFIPRRAHPLKIPTCSSKAAFYLEVGRMENRPEGNGGTTLLASNRHLRDVLRAKGYTIQYAEVYGDHDPVHWRRTLPEALTVMLGN